jgi:hypothetical protein
LTGEVPLGRQAPRTRATPSDHLCCEDSTVWTGTIELIGPLCVASRAPPGSLAPLRSHVADRRCGRQDCSSARIGPLAWPFRTAPPQAAG